MYQVFIGMVTMQYQAQSDMVELIERLERACIRFVHFSKVQIDFNSYIQSLIWGSVNFIPPRLSFNLWEMYSFFLQVLIIL